MFSTRIKPFKTKNRKNQMQTKRQESWFVVNRKESKVKNLTQEERIISWSRGASNISSVSLKKMGFLSQQISRDELKPGDHIYSWRNAYIYAHHGSILSLLSSYM